MYADLQNKYNTVSLSLSLYIYIYIYIYTYVYIYIYNDNPNAYKTAFISNCTQLKTNYIQWVYHQNTNIENGLHGLYRQLSSSLFHLFVSGR